MIKVNRAPCPAVLTKPSKRKDRYNLDTVVQTLWHMQHEKCCYCESRIPRRGRGKEVEHFWPKSKYPELRNTWENLLLACPVCNGEKLDKFPIRMALSQSNGGAPAVDEAGIVDPSKQDPEEHLDYFFNEDDEESALNAQIVSKSDVGRESIAVNGLDSEPHLKIRRDHYRYVLSEQLRNLYIGYLEHDIQKLTRAKDHFYSLVSVRHPLAALSRAFARFHMLDKAPFHLEIPGPAAEPQGA